jgi:hypothetical protein
MELLARGGVKGACQQQRKEKSPAIFCVAKVYQ